MEPTSGTFPLLSPGQLGYPELTPAQLADPMTPVTVNGITLKLWQVSHIYGVNHKPPVDHGKGKETAAADEPGVGTLGNTAQSSDEGAGDQSNSGLSINRGRQLSQTSSGTSGSFNPRPARREGIIGYPSGGGPTPVDRTRSTSRERPEPRTPAPRPKYSLFPRIDPPRTPQIPTPTTPNSLTTTTTRAPAMAQPTGPSKPGQSQQGQPELKSVWERSPSPPDWKKTMKGAVSKGLRQVSSSLNLRSKKSKAGLKEPQNQEEGKGQEKSATPGQDDVPPMPPLRWNTSPVHSHQTTNPGPTRPASPGGPEVSSASRQASGSQYLPSGSTAAKPPNMKPPPTGRYQGLYSGRSGFSAPSPRPFAPEKDDDPKSAPPPIPPRSARRPPPPEDAPGSSRNQMATQNCPAQSPSPTPNHPHQPSSLNLSSGSTTATTLPALPSPRYPPPPPPPPPSPPRAEQQRGRSKSITNLFRKAKESEDKTSKGSK